MCRNKANCYSFGKRKLVSAAALLARPWAWVKTLKPLDSLTVYKQSKYVGLQIIVNCLLFSLLLI